MIITMITLSPVAGKRDTILELLRFIQGVVRGRMGFISCGIYEQRGGDRNILYLEQWQSTEDVSRHIQSDQYRRVLLAMELGSRPPEVCYFEVADVKGMSWIKELRSQYEELG